MNASSASFTCPETTRIGTTLLQPAFAAVLQNDSLAIKTLRSSFPGGAAVFDRFATGLRLLSSGNGHAATREFQQAPASEWHIVFEVLRALAMISSGQVSVALEEMNKLYSTFARKSEWGKPNRAGDKAFVTAGLSVFAALDELQTEQPAQIGTSAPFHYLVSYPRSGSTMLREFLTFVFSAPAYSVYPGDGRYFSRSYYNRDPNHPVFVKDHNWKKIYRTDQTLFLARDGRNAMISFARFQHAQGYNDFVGRGQLADFIISCNTNPYVGFWGKHTRDIVEAAERGARIRVLRYEQLFRNYPALIGLARELGRPMFEPVDDQAAYEAFVADKRPEQDRAPGWREGIPLPGDSYIPHNWSIGGDTINWRAAFDNRARRVFHELGGTEMLLRLGYETDEGWWRADAN